MAKLLDFSTKYCIIGAGSSGIAAAKSLKDRDIAFDVIEREDDIGGNWYYGKPNSSVYQSTHLISSKPLTQYGDYPMPDSFPDYPRHDLVLKYLRAYAREFGLYPYISFNTSVERVASNPAGDYWDVTLSTGETRRYRGVIIANGHNWDPKIPNINGQFAGITMHSAEYKTPEVLRGRRILVIGGGNSGCDIAVESAQNAALTFHSLRRGYHYVPKYAFGKPADQIGEMTLRWRLPLAIRRTLNGILLKVLVGDLRGYGLPKPDHKLFETHPIINSQILYYLKHGEIIPRPDVLEMGGYHVRFADNSVEEVDVVIYATGFNISFPFIDKRFLNWQDGRPDFYMNIFHPQVDNFFIVGLIQPDSGQFGLVELQAKLIAQFIHAQEHQPQKAARFSKRKAREKVNLSHGIKYVDSTRHYLEVEHFSYRNKLKSLLRGLQ